VPARRVDVQSCFWSNLSRIDLAKNGITAVSFRVSGKYKKRPSWIKESIARLLIRHFIFSLTLLYLFFMSNSCSFHGLVLKIHF
jgi:hypothetical protein